MLYCAFERKGSRRSATTGGIAASSSESKSRPTEEELAELRLLFDSPDAERGRGGRTVSERDRLGVENVDRTLCSSRACFRLFLDVPGVILFRKAIEQVMPVKTRYLHARTHGHHRRENELDGAGKVGRRLVGAGKERRQNSGQISCPHRATGGVKIGWGLEQNSNRSTRSSIR